MLVVLFSFFRTGMGRQINHYAIYLLIGIIHFTHFSTSTSAAMTALYSMRQLTRNTIMPKEVLVIGAVISNVTEFVVSLLICIGIASLSGVELHWTVVLIPLVVLLQLMMVSWISFFLSCLFVFVRDIGYIYQVFLRILFFITPTFYTPDFLGGGVARYIVLINPLAHLISFSRAVVIDGRVFPVKLFLIFAALNAILILLSFKIFKRYEPRFAEFI
jgi:ABC-type polysaccharide/polyol phosphate export permease